MKVLLIYPEYPATFWSFKHALPFINKKVSLPPLGLLTVASLIPKEWEKKLIDLNAAELKDKDIIWADYVFISGMVVQRKSAKEVIKRAKSFGKFIVAGGPLFTNDYYDFENVDCFVLNEGEVTIPLFLKDLENNKLKHIYKSDEKPDLAITPVPDWSLINSNDYASLSIQISRGCPYNCDFCDIIIMNGRVPRLKSPEQVIRELGALYNYGWRGGVFIVDDNFIGNKIEAERILRKIVQWMDEKNKPFTLFTEASINLADDLKLMGLMQKANFDSVFIGIETPEEDGLLSCGKLHNTKKDLIEKVKIIQRNGLEVQGGFILGFDTDTQYTFDNMIKFIQNSGIVTAMVGLLHAIPETRLYKRLHSEKRILTIPTGDNTDFSLNFIPDMSIESLMKGYKKVIDTIFAPKYYYKRIITYLKEYNKTAVNKKLSLRQQVKALSKTIWKIGITGKGKFHFWKLMFWTIFRKPSLIPEAITHSIYGYHYRTVLLTKRENKH
ncbi:MAG TPA: B12-binding domain-containing radical SAM protein [Ignavibacteria bacterium]